MIVTVYIQCEAHLRPLHFETVEKHVTVTEKKLFTKSLTNRETRHTVTFLQNTHQKKNLFSAVYYDDAWDDNGKDAINRNTELHPTTDTTFNPSLLPPTSCQTKTTTKYKQQRQQKVANKQNDTFGRR